MKRTPLVVANWKMHGQNKWIENYIHELVKPSGDADKQPGQQTGLQGQCEIVLCPPFVYLSRIHALLQHSGLKLGAQNLHDAEHGAFTGEVSAHMLLDVGCTYVVVGHSERRRLLGETDPVVAEKFLAALRNRLIPILCVGENEAEREAGITELVVRRQLDAVIQLCGAEAFARAVIAYEPVWAIGTGLTATPKQAQAVQGFIRSYVASHNAVSASNVRILYGGSVKAGNAAELAREEDIDGALVGGASLIVKDFLAICAGFDR